MAVTSQRQTHKQSRRGKTRIRRRPLTIIIRLLHECWGAIRAIIKAVRTSPPIIRAIITPALLITLWFSLNWAYHTFNKPTEVFFPLDRSLNKYPGKTWKHYESLFREHATAIITPEFLAALAQVESGGNPVARTYWRWKLTWNPFELYQPASSAVGMFQITDGTFREATRYCIHNHVVVEDDAWHNLKSCWFNSLYTRVLPSHAIELTSAFLDHRVTELLGTKSQIKKTTLQKKQDLAAIIHLCGAGAGRAYTKRGLRLTSHQRCGDHDVSNYLARINALKKKFSKSGARGKTIRQAH